MTSADILPILTEWLSIMQQSDHELEAVLVSVSRPDRIPTWNEMCLVKSLFWSDDACVMQLHPPKSDLVNNHTRCLHLWRPVDAEIPRPPSIMVGDASLGRIA